MPDFPSLDLAIATDWYGVRPGMKRAEVQASLEKHGLEVGSYGEHTLTALAEEWEMEFYFAPDGSDRLLQLSFEDDVILWHGQPVTGVSLDEALRTIDAPEPAQWTPWDVIRNPYPRPEETPASLPADEQLMDGAAVWLPRKGLGLLLYEGKVGGIIWRGPADLPARYFGVVTEAQRELSKRKDLEEYLQEKRMERHRVEERKDPLRIPRFLVNIAFVLAAAWTGKGALETTKLWHQATDIQAKFISVEMRPYKQFRDFLPPELRWAVPPGKTVMVESYRVEYTAPTGERQEAVLERGELYVPPEKPGDEVPIVYAGGDPPQVHGLSRARDVAFIEYLPRFIVLGGLLLAAHFLLSILPGIGRRLLPLLRRALASRGTKDPDRPELS